MGAAIAAQAFALLGVAVGFLTIVVGVGPRTAPDVVYHLAIAAVLAWGWPQRSDGCGPPASR